jgi:hypothetical protein
LRLDDSEVVRRQCESEDAPLVRDWGVRALVESGADDGEAVYVAVTGRSGFDVTSSATSAQPIFLAERLP